MKMFALIDCVYITSLPLSALMDNRVLFVAASAMSQYAAAVPGYSWPLPPAATAAAAAAAAAGTMPMSPYQAAQPQLQEARMQ